MLLPTPNLPTLPVDPYRGVALGVECAWPAAATLRSDLGDLCADCSRGQYTVSTGTPNK
jgi:hypothetical protein